MTMRMYLKMTIPLFFCILLLLGIAPLTHAAEVPAPVPYDNISIGGGGSFFQPLIDPTDSSRYIVFCDMNGLYRSNDAGESWERTETPIAFSHACFSDDGILYAGSSGLYASYDHGETLQILYPHPSTIQTTVSRLGRNDLNILAGKDYNNSYVLCVTEHGGRVYFITMDWSTDRELRLLSCDPYGDELVEYHREDTHSTLSPLNQRYQIEVDDTAIYYADGERILRYGLDDAMLTEVYHAQGSIRDFQRIEDTFFILDDLETKTLILYTQDFSSYQDLSTQNTLPSTFKATGVVYSFSWHYTMLAGNSLDSIFFVMHSEIDESCPLNSDLGGVLKYDGTAFAWVYDPVYQTNRTYRDAAWTTYAVDPIYGICSDPQDDTHCLMTNIHSVYDIYYDTNYQDGKMQHCTTHTVEDVTYYTSTGLDCQTTYFVHEDPFDENHILISTTDIGLQISYDGGESFRRVEKQAAYWSVYNTCYDLYFDENTEGVVYGLWSSRHDVPNTAASLSDRYAQGYFGISYDGGIHWDFSYSTGLPTNSIPVKMSVVPQEDELLIAVATFNNGFYISYDSGRTFTSISGEMAYFEGMLWGEDVVIANDLVYCLTAYHSYVGTAATAVNLAALDVYPAVTDVVPSILYVYDLTTGETTTVDLGDIVIARSLTYDPAYGLYINVIPYYYWGWNAELQANYYINYGGGVYACADGEVTLVLPIENGASHSAFAADGVLYVAADKGTIYYREPTDTAFHVYVDGLFPRMKNISFSRDGGTLYATTFGGGTYRMPTLPQAYTAPQYTVTFVDWDSTILSTQTVSEGQSALLPAVPSRVPDESYHYTFSRWSENTSVVDCDIVVYACYVYKPHTVGLQNAAEATCTTDGYTGDQACLSCGYVYDSGEVLPALGHTMGTTLTKADGTHGIHCAVCEEEFLVVTCTDEDDDGYCDVCGYKFPIYYTVTFVDWDGTTLSTQTVLEEEAAVPPTSPTREADGAGSYAFAGWDTDVRQVQCDCVVTAVYTFTAHSPTCRGAWDATCTEEGYTGDTYCSLCGTLLEEGITIAPKAHTPGDAKTDHDGTHTFSCMTCGIELDTEACVDDDNDGCCDACGFGMRLMRFTKVSAFQNDRQYLLVGDGYALRGTITAEAVSLSAANGYYTTPDTIPADMLWTYRNGYLSTTYNGQTYYLAAYRSYQAANYTLSIDKQIWMASFWSYRKGALSTQVNDWRYRITKYLYIKDGAVTLSSSGSITLYQLEN